MQGIHGMKKRPQIKRRVFVRVFICGGNFALPYPMNPLYLWQKTRFGFALPTVAFRFVLE